ncbi:glycoside hydrolase family 3 protein [Aurantiacibacter xanthus]|uniref:beta-glucosidase n=1 Tax=Aurantiacibacter xanthus TaxID=1784712 RepID=A0A3A1P2L8_9SPHN|nr:glycoside hydrolase family 3 N-terminal domain-containing protein [Aurantiacibacter xanthus]RIV84122.1 glycoside hydrolase family 3 protein [Aurantiacibacter xanthus]
MKNTRIGHSMALLFGTASLLGACVSTPATAPELSTPQAPIAARVKPVITVDGLRFKDLNASGTLDPYEDWRLTAEQRADDLASRMTLAEKAGMMLIATNNPACDGTVTDTGREMIEQRHMTRFILRATATPEGADCSVELSGFALRGGYDQTPSELAGFTNAVQELREGTRLGIPALFKDNARNHVEVSPTFGIGQGAGSFTEFPKEAGLAAAMLGAGAPLSASDGMPPANLRPDPEVLRQFTRVMGQEWRAVGLRGMYGYMLDLGTEPRWSRFHETFSENADLVGLIGRELVAGLQGPKGADGLALSPDTAVSMTVKHFPGGGPQHLGLDAHYTFGKDQFYTDPSGNYGFDYHLRPFAEAVDAGVAAIMPYYGVPVGAMHNGEELEQVGMAFSPAILRGLLREELGFGGYINSDSGIIEERGWGLEDYRINPRTGKNFTVTDRTQMALEAGVDVISEFRSAEVIVDLVEQGAIDEATVIDPAIRHLLVEQFALGLFENPYVAAEEADRIVGSSANHALGLAMQRRSIVLLQNRELDGRPVLPLAQGSSVYVMGVDPTLFAKAGFAVTDGNPASGGTRPAVPAGTDYAVLSVLVNNAPAGRYRSDDPATGGQALPETMQIIDPHTGQQQASWGAQDPCVVSPGEGVNCVDSRLYFGGAFPWEASELSLSAMAASQSWVMYPSLTDIRAVMAEIGDPRRVIVSIYFRNPYAIDRESGVREAGALLATLGVSEEALVDVIGGQAAPGGRLPFALPASVRAIEAQHSDAPGYGETEGGTLFPFGFGLGYEAGAKASK